MGGLLKDGDMDQLEQWIGTGPKTFTLLYKISRDGCNATTFHQKCDNQGATVTVLYNQQQTVYGGYTSQSWTSRGTFFNDGSAFLYRLHYNGKPSPVQMPRSGNGNDVYDDDYGYDYHDVYDDDYCYDYQDVYDDASYGPTFGGGHDLYTFTGTVYNSGGYFALNGYMRVGYSYNIQDLQANTINNGTMNVTDLEVYKVADGQREKTIVRNDPWREIGILDPNLVTSLEQKTVEFKVDESLKVDQARIVMIGPVGAGKSSWCNTINSVFKGRVTQKAYSGSAEKSLTTQYTQYVIRARSGSMLNFRICDTPGLEENQGLDSVEFTYLLDGHIPNFYEFNPNKPIQIGKQGFILTPTLDQKIHMVVFVLDVSNLDVLQDILMDKIKNFQQISRQKGVPQVMLLTQVDKICEEVSLDMSEAFKSEAVRKAVEKAAHTFGLPLNCVLPVKNYQSEVSLRCDISGVALITLMQILNFTADHFENMTDEMKETSLPE